jgi:uncharacterized membrane protein YfcA
VIDFFFLFVAGLVGGFLGGLLGIGGGIIYIIVIPASLQHLGVPPAEMVQYTIANSIVASLFSALSANYFLVKTKHFYPTEVVTIGFFGVISSLLVLHGVVNTSWYSRGAFNVVIVLLLVYMLLKTLANAAKPLPVENLEQEGRGLRLGLAGLASGTVSALSGLGGGIIIIPILNSVFKMDIKKANSISLGAIGITSLTLTLSSMLETPQQPFDFYNVGYVIFPVVLALSLGVIIASPFGVKAGSLLSSRVISYLFSFFLGLVILRKIIELAAFPG